MSKNVIQYLISPQYIPHIQEKYCNISYFGFHDWTLLTMAAVFLMSSISKPVIAMHCLLVFCWTVECYKLSNSLGLSENEGKAADPINGI